MPTGKAGLISAEKTWNDLSFETLSLTSFDNLNLFSIVAKDAKNGWLQINFTNTNVEDAEIKIYSVLGTLLIAKNQKLQQGVNDVQITPIVNCGFYIVKIIPTQGTHYSQKVVVP